MIWARLRWHLPFYRRLRERRDRWVRAHRNAVCDSCGYTTRNPWWCWLLGRTACPACWEDGGVLVRLSREPKL